MLTESLSETSGVRMMFAASYAELVLIVSDVQRAAQFYRDVVRLIPEAKANDEWAWFFVGDPNMQQRLALHKGTLLFEEHSPHPEGKRWGQVHFALRVPREKFNRAIEHIQSFNITIHGPTRFDWMQATSSYFYDPDGNLIEFWSPDE